MGSLMDAIARWVEESKPPESITAEMRDKAGKLIRARPLFPYPQVAKYKGSGDTNDEKNFTCVAEKKP